MLIVGVFVGVLLGLGIREGFADASLSSIHNSIQKRWLSYTMHAISRMKERGITRKEVEMTIRNGEINPYSSRPPSKYSIEANVGGKRIRVVLAPQFWFFAYVVTVIEL